MTYKMLRTRIAPQLVCLLLAIAFFGVATLAAGPALAQERARLVNPKKKEAPKEAETSEASDAAESDREITPRADRERERLAKKDAKRAEKEARKQAKQAQKQAQEQTAASPDAVSTTTAAATASSATAPVATESTGASADRPAAERPAPARAAPERPAAPAVTRGAESPAPATTDVFRDDILVGEVLLDVLVTDKKGNVITGLGPEDFIVEEEGQEAEVRSLTFYGARDELRGSGVAGETRSDRYFILLFHDQKQAAPVLTSQQLSSGRYAKRWIEEDLEPNDQVAVIGYDVRLKLYQDFTRDRQALMDAVESAALGGKDLDRYKTASDPDFDPDSPSLFVNLPTGKTLARESRLLQEALGLIGRAAKPIVGRKNLLLFSTGYGSLALGTPNWQPDPRYYPDMIESLNAGNVAVYAIDTQGTGRGRTQVDVSGSLSSIALDTGGRFYWNFTNHRTPLVQIGEDTLGYYLLSYETRYPRDESGYREVEVRTQDKKHKVRARRGYRYGT